MGRYLGPSCRLCRREGEKLFLKGARCYTYKCAIERREYAPGQHGARRPKLSNYGLQLREKQKLKRIYGLLEKQFRLYFSKAARKTGVTGSTLLQYLERRLDNTVYQAGFTTSRNAGRQMVGHGLVYVNDKRVNIPSFLINKDDEISIKAKDSALKGVKDNLEASKGRQVPEWLALDANHLKAKIVRLPQREDIQQPINEQLVVELYSR
jgi:small subunit ribosomal protein S4